MFRQGEALYDLEADGVLIETLKKHLKPQGKVRGGWAYNGPVFVETVVLILTGMVGA